MLIIPSPLFTSFRNKFGTSVLYPIAGRQIGREFVIPTNPDTAFQSAVRDNFSAASIAYSALSASDKQSWESLAAQVTITDAYGQESQIPAKAMYMRVNSYRQLAGLALVSTAPPLGTASPVTLPQVGYVVTVNRVIVSPDETISVGVIGESDSDGSQYLISLSDILPGTTRVARPTDLRLATVDPSESYATVPSAGVIVTPSTTGRFAWQNDDRVGVRVVTLTDEYVPRAEAFAPNVLVQVIEA